jgi:hypothetical protein
VAIAMRRGELTDVLRAHAKECPICAEAATVAAAFASLTDDDLPARSPIDARVLWLKAQLVPRSSDSTAGAGTSRGAIAVWAIVAACWALFLAWRWADLRSLLELMTPATLLTGSVNQAALPVASLAVVMVMAAVTLGIMLHQVFVEEL